jgi:hypothetical protein
MPTTIFSCEDREPRSYRMVRVPFRFIGLLVLCVIRVILALSIFRVTRIGAGYVGIEINLAASQRGASEIPIRTGWVFYSPLKTQIVDRGQPFTPSVDCAPVARMEAAGRAAGIYCSLERRTCRTRCWGDKNGLMLPLPREAR